MRIFFLIVVALSVCAFVLGLAVVVMTGASGPAIAGAGSSLVSATAFSVAAKMYERVEAGR